MKPNTRVIAYTQDSNVSYPPQTHTHTHTTHNTDTQMTRSKEAAKKKKGAALVAAPRRGPIGNGKKKKGEENNYATAYKAALMNPFSVAAQGARVPDMYSAPTVPKHFTLTAALTSSSVASVPSQLIILPNLFMPIICPGGDVTGGITWTTMDGLNNVAKCVINPTVTLSSQLTNYRIVGYGVRIYNAGSINTTAGRVIVATSPVSSWVNLKAATIGGQATTSVNAAASAFSTYASYGLPTVIVNGSYVIDSGALPGMQNCIETSLVSLAANPVVVTPKVNSPEAFEFRQTGDSAVGFSINNQTSASYVSSGDASYLRVAGHELVVISVVGAPTNTSVLQVEVVYHLEGSPSYSALSGDAPQVVAAPSTMAEIVAAAARSSSFKMGVETAGNAILPGLGTFVRSLT